MIAKIPFIFFFSFATLFLLRKVAKNINLVDVPTKRKQHIGAIPLVGGLSLYIVMAYDLLSTPIDSPYSFLYLLSITVLIIVGVCDDKFNLSVKLRMFVEIMVTLFAFYFANIKLHTLGDIFGINLSIDLGILSVLITILSVVGAINAYNMVDGIDGLLGGLSIVTFTGIGILLHSHEYHYLSQFCVVIIVALLPYIFMNLGFLGRQRKVFMGDAGSMVIGFTVIWLLLRMSQFDGDSPIRPVTALWLIGIPLMDMVTTMIRRMRQGHSPFRADREHLHHIYQRLGYSAHKTLIVICLLSAAFTSVGVIGELMKVPESIMFYAYIVSFIAYIFLTNHIRKVVKVITGQSV